jgi:hypothetical protein
MTIPDADSVKKMSVIHGYALFINNDSKIIPPENETHEPGFINYRLVIFFNPAQSLGRNAYIKGNVILGNPLQKMLMTMGKSYIPLFGSFGIECCKMIRPPLRKSAPMSAFQTGRHIAVHCKKPVILITY